MNPFYRRPSLLLVPVLLVAGCGLLTDPPDPPGRPEGLVARGQSMSSVLVSWSAPSSGDEVASYEIERSASTGDFELVASPTGTALSFTDTGLASDQSYRYRVRACNEGGCSSYTATSLTRTFGVIDITTTSLPSGAVGQPYLESVQAANAGDSYEWSVVSGALPSGLVLDDTAGVISGVAVAEETAQFTMQARSIDGQTAQEALSIEIVAALPISILNLVLPPVAVGGDYDVALRHSGGGASATWSLVSGTLPAGLSLDPAGWIQGTVTATDTAAITLRVESAGESDEASFSLAVVANDETAFNITPMPVSSIPVGVQPHVDSALARWERAITGDVEPIFIPAGSFSSSSCGGFGADLNGTSLDDVIMIINIGPIDGPGGTLGFAGPCSLRSGGTDPDVPLAGTLTLDSDDLLPMTGTNTLTALVFHEMGHILGFGSLWSYLGLVQGSGTAFPTYTGSNGQEEYEALGGTGAVPLEGEGGPGTAEVHWRESVFDTEIMTGFSEAVGTPQPLSRMTIASMDDLGYTADRDEADPYSLADMAMLGSGLEDLGYDIVYTGPMILIGPDGTVIRGVMRRPEH